MKLVFIVPCRNEEFGVKKVLEKIPKNAKVIVVDNNSSDKTAIVSKKAGATILFEKKQGKGFAFKKAVEYVKKIEFDFVIMIDGDDTYDPKEITKFLQKIDGFDVIVGNRLTSTLKPIELNWFYLMGNRFLTSLANLLYYQKTKDICSGYWVFKKEAIKKIDIRANGFDLEADLFSECCKKKLKLGFVPITYGKRIGKEKLKIRDSVIIAKRLLINRFFCFGCFIENCDFSRLFRKYRGGRKISSFPCKTIKRYNNNHKSK